MLLGQLYEDPVGASLLAKNVNDDADILNARGALTFFREQARSHIKALQRQPTPEKK